MMKSMTAGRSNFPLITLSFIIATLCLAKKYYLENSKVKAIYRHIKKRHCERFINTCMKKWYYKPDIGWIQFFHVEYHRIVMGKGGDFCGNLCQYVDYKSIVPSLKSMSAYKYISSSNQINEIINSFTNHFNIISLLEDVRLIEMFSKNEIPSSDEIDKIPIIVKFEKSDDPDLGLSMLWWSNWKKTRSLWRHEKVSITHIVA